jgi:hypothetical protein
MAVVSPVPVGLHPLSTFQMLIRHDEVQTRSITLDVFSRLAMLNPTDRNGRSVNTRAKNFTRKPLGDFSF